MKDIRRVVFINGYLRPEDSGLCEVDLSTFLHPTIQYAERE